MQLLAAPIHRQALVFVQHRLAVLATDAQLLLHFLIEILQRKLQCTEHRFVDFTGKFALAIFETAAYFFGVALENSPVRWPEISRCRWLPGG